MIPTGTSVRKTIVTIQCELEVAAGNTIRYIEKRRSEKRRSILKS